MARSELALRVAALVLPSLLALAGVAQTQGRNVSNVELTNAIAAVRTAETNNDRYAAADRLSELVSSVSPKAVDDDTIAELVSLLDMPDDFVRHDVAFCFYHLGRRAKIAIPKLRQVLVRSDCLDGSRTSSPVIRGTLKKMGVTVPPKPSIGSAACPMTEAELIKAIAEARTGATATIRGDALDYLPQLTRWIDADSLSDKTIVDLIALLDISDVSTRSAVVASLANVGPRASGAVPKLQGLLPMVDCLKDAEDVELASSVRRALSQMGVEPPPKCGTQSK